MIVAVVATRDTAPLATATVRSLAATNPQAKCRVLDVDGTYRATGDEVIVPVAMSTVPAARLALTHDDDALRAALTVLWAAEVAADSKKATVGLAPGVLVIADLATLGDEPGETIVVRRSSAAVPDALEAPSLLATELFVLGTGALPHMAALRHLAEGAKSASQCLDVFALQVPHRILIDDAVLVSRWNTDAESTFTPGAAAQLTRAGRNVIAVDAAGFNPEQPWTFDATSLQGPLLSRNPVLAELLLSAITERVAITPPCDAELVREIANDELAAGGDLADAIGRVDDWLLELVPVGSRSPVTRYLAGIWSGRPDVRASYPSVPGRDVPGFCTWAVDYGTMETRYDAERLRTAVAVTLAAQPELEPEDAERPFGVNVVGYLSGALGVGVSARLMTDALAAADVPTSTFAVTTDLQSHADVTYRKTEPILYDTTLLAVNADQTDFIAHALHDVVAGTTRIGMWYWEVESFPKHPKAFSEVYEVWAATDFVRDAIASQSPVRVRTVMPPLPQRHLETPPPVPTRLGIPDDRPWFLFVFDYLSTAERKNPWGLFEAFTRAFAPGEGPVLVIKTMNSSRRVAEAERLRILAATRLDVIVIDEFLPEDELTALMANCTAYVSLHRAEGLGLTIAEAMAWGRPVIVSAYSGNMAFTNDKNALLVPCGPTPIPPDAAPYPAGSPWAAPDLDVAAAHMRFVVAEPAQAAELGKKAAHDIATFHSPEAAASRVKDAVIEVRTERLDAIAAAKAAAEAEYARQMQFHRRTGRRLQRTWNTLRDGGWDQ